MLPCNQFSLKFNTTRLESVHELTHTVNENCQITQGRAKENNMRHGTASVAGEEELYCQP